MTLAFDTHIAPPLSDSSAPSAPAAPSAPSAPAAPAAPAEAVDAVEASVEELVRQHLPLVGYLVREVGSRVPGHVHRDDLVSAAMFALAASAKSFDQTIGAPFSKFAAIRIRGALTDELRSMDWASRGVRSKARQVDTARTALAQTLGRIPTHAEVARAMGVTVAELASIEHDVDRASVARLQALSEDGGADVVRESAEGPEALLVRREQLGYLRDAVELLPDRLRSIVEQYFFEQRKMADIAADLGVTESRVSQLRSEALVMLREGMKAADAGDQVDADAQTLPTAKPAAKGRAAVTAAYRTSVAQRSSVAGRLTASTLLGQSVAELRRGPQSATG